MLDALISDCPDLLPGSLNIRSVPNLWSLGQANRALHIHVRSCLRARFPFEQRVFVGGGYTPGSSDDLPDDDPDHESVSATRCAFWIVLGVGLQVSFSPLPHLPHNCGGFCSASITSDGRIVVVADCWNGDLYHTEVFIFDSVTQQWATTYKLPDELPGNLTVAITDDDIFLFAGKEDRSGEIFPFKLEDRRWVQLPRLREVGCYIHNMQFNTCTVELLLVGKRHNRDHKQDEILAIVYSLAENTWAIVGQNLTLREDQAICVAPNGNVMTTGGWACVDFHPARVVVLQSCEEVVVEKSAHLSLTNAMTQRFGHSLVMVYKNHFLQLGGVSERVSEL